MTDQERAQYPGGAEQRVADIEAGAGRAPDALIGDLRDSQRLLVAAWRELPDEAWQRTGVWLTAGRQPVDTGLRARRRELLVHVVDLDLGVRPEDLPEDFLADDRDWLGEHRGWE